VREKQSAMKEAKNFRQQHAEYAPPTERLKMNGHSV